MKKIKTINELDEILANGSNRLSVLKVSACWCAPCKMLARTISEIEDSLENVDFYEVDVDEAESELIEKYEIQSVPVLLFFNEGLQVDRVVGARNKKDLLEIIEKNK